MPTILHISDLHRTSAPRLNNDQLLAAITSDAARWDAEGISRPDLIVISGDLIQGAAPAASDPEAEIAAQYAEAGDFIRRLTKEFVAGDQRRVVLVPGNHDVCWSRARKAMASVAVCPTDIARVALEPESGVRWDWATREAHEIVDRDMYESRLEPFRTFQAQFYAGIDPNPLAHGPDLLFFDYPELDLAVAGFASWHGNDCFCEVGEIDSRVIARSRQVLADSGASLAVAVWHHSVAGGPRARDYMDQRVIHQMIDFGFSVGLHGHQHYADAAPYEIRLPNLTLMTVVGGGSLAVGDSHLPMGERRQFNIVVLDPVAESVTVHVRGMSRGGVFTGAHRDDFGGHTFVKLPLQRSPARPRSASAAAILDDAMSAIKAADYKTALDMIEAIGSSHSAQKRQVRLKALTGLGRDDDVIALLDPPTSADEAVQVVALLLSRGEFDEAQRRVDLLDQRLLDESLRNELALRINTHRMMRS